MRKETPLDSAGIARRLDTLPGWAQDGQALSRTYTTSGWGSTLMVVNAIGFLCEAAGHHPDLSVSWSSVGVRLWTHTAEGITALDFDAARLIEDTVLWTPPASSSLSGPPKPIVSGNAAPPA